MPPPEQQPKPTILPALTKEELQSRLNYFVANGLQDDAAKLRILYKHILSPDVPLETESKLKEFITQDSKMLLILKHVRRLSKVNAPVFISGPTGTGKEILARALHGERKGNFVDVNCAGLPENLIESELFGHCKGAFTGALLEKKGLWLQAQNGTLFLDEIGDFPLGVQAKLLRALQQREVRPVGSNLNIQVNARIVCATHKPIEKMVEDGRFREDLYHRLTTFDLRLTPLEDRPDDIPLILEYIARKYERENKITGDKIADIDKLHVKPKELKGNVRTLERVIERYYVLGEMPT